MVLEAGIGTGVLSFAAAMCGAQVRGVEINQSVIKLANNISDGFDAIGDTSFPIESPSPLNVPDIDIIAIGTNEIPSYRSDY